MRQKCEVIFVRRQSEQVDIWYRLREMADASLFRQRLAMSTMLIGPPNLRRVPGGLRFTTYSVTFLKSAGGRLMPAILSQ